LSQLLEPSGLSIADSGARPRDLYGQSLPPLEHAPGTPEAGGTPWHMMTRPLKVDGPKVDAPHGDAPKKSRVIENSPSPNLSRSQSLALYEGDFDIGLAAFCRGAGIEPRSVSPDARGAALQLAGQLLREAVLGLMDLNQGRNEFRNKFRIPAPSADGAESALNLAKGVDEAMVRLLTTISTRAGSVEAIRDNFRELKAQNSASLTATRAAFEEFLSRVDPKELEQRFDRAGKRGVFGGQSKAKYWDLYAELFAGLAQRPADGFPHVFTETFAKAYETRMRALIPPKRSAFGADRDDANNPSGHAVGDA
jgi:type VI secretion system FHA domain protein